MPITPTNGSRAELNKNFPDTEFSRSEQKARGQLPRDEVDTDDEKRVVAGTLANRRQINTDFFARQGLTPLPSRPANPVPPGDKAYEHLNALFGSGAHDVGTVVGTVNTPEIAREAVRRLSTNLVPPNETRTMHRGGSIEESQIEALWRVLSHGDTEDNHTVSHIMLHGYRTVEGTRSKARPPSVSSDEEIAEMYARPCADPTSRELRFFLSVKGETAVHRAALGASCAFQINAAGGQREFILDDRNTYFTTRAEEDGNRITLHIEVTGPSRMGRRAQARAGDPDDRASISPQAAKAGRAAERAREQQAKEKASEDAEIAAAAHARDRATSEAEWDAKNTVAREAREYAQLHAGDPCLEGYDQRFNSFYDGYYAEHIKQAMRASKERLYSDLHAQYFQREYKKHLQENYDQNLKNAPLWGSPGHARIEDAGAVIIFDKKPARAGDDS